MRYQHLQKRKAGCSYLHRRFSDDSDLPYLMKNRKMYSDMIQSVKANNIDVDDFLWNEFSKNHKIEAGENGEEH